MSSSVTAVPGQQALDRQLGRGLRVADVRDLRPAAYPPPRDLVCYWFHKAGQQIASGKAKRAGLVATNSIRGGANRRALSAAMDDRRILRRGAMSRG